jgi:hypothetical protein
MSRTADNVTSEELAVKRSDWWQSRGLLPLATLAAAAPLVWPRIPPFADVPGHMASYHVSVALSHSAALQRFFTFHWQLVGNLGVDLLVVPLAPLIGVEAATKLIVLAIPALTALALLLLARQAHGRLPATALAAVPLAYNSPFLWGFVNYSLAAALALLGLAWWQRWPSDERPLTRAAAFALVAATVWLCHAIGWLMLVSMCGSLELHRRVAAREGTGARPVVGALVGAAVACLGLALPFALMRLSQHADQGGMFGWFWLHQIFWAAVKLLRDRWPVWDVAATAVLALLVAAALFRLARLRLAPALAWPAVALAALFVCLPMSIDGSLYVNTRIVPYALALGVVAVDTSALSVSRQAQLALASALFCAARLLGNTASFVLYDQSYTRELGALDHLPRGATVLTLVEMGCDGAQPRLEHIAGMATVRRDAFVNVLWTIKGLQLLRDRMPQAAPFRDDPSEFVSSARCASHQPARAAFATAPLNAFSHVWLIGVPADERPRNPRLAPVWAAASSVLYRVTPAKSAAGQQPGAVK